jgi:signal transduction histidine kinase
MQGQNNSIAVSLVSSAIVIFLIYNELFLVTKKSKNIFIILSSCMVILLTTELGFISDGRIYQYFYLVVIFQIMRVLGYKMSMILLIISIFLRIFVLSYHLDSEQRVISAFLSDVWVYAIGDIVFALITYIFIQNNELLYIKEKLTTQNIVMESTYENLRRAYNKLEDYTIVKERTNLAREMHDTVGHTLTTTLVELEMCKMLVKNAQDISGHLDNVSEQVRKGLYELRTTVTKMKDNVNWYEEIIILIDRIIKNTGISITTYIDDISNLDKNILSCCYRIIQEGITNGLKHGNASAFIVNICLAEENIKLAVIDNGNGCSGFNKGFGLTAMFERVNELGGTIEFENSVDGFSINAQLPL